MSERNLRLVSVGTNDITFADPQSATRTTRFTHSFTQVSDQVLGRVNLHRAELISLRDVMMTKPNCVDACNSALQNISVRIKVSAPLELSAEATQQIVDALDNMKAAYLAGLTDGFLPTVTTVLKADVGVA